MQKSRSEIAGYARKIISRGDGYPAVLRYMDRMEVGPDDQKYILQDLRLWEKRNPVQPEKNPKPLLDLSTVLGILMIAGGGAMALMLWNRGWVSTVPLIITGGGIAALLGKRNKTTNRRK